MGILLPGIAKISTHHTRPDQPAPATPALQLSCFYHFVEVRRYFGCLQSAQHTVNTAGRPQHNCTFATTIFCKMKFRSSVVASTLLALSGASSSEAFVPSKHTGRVPSTSLLKGVAVDETVDQVASDSKIEALTNDIISKLRFREVQKELEMREMDSSGTLSAMRSRLREVTLSTTVSPKNGAETLNIDEDALNEVRFTCSWIKPLPEFKVLNNLPLLSSCYRRPLRTEESTL